MSVEGEKPLAEVLLKRLLDQDEISFSALLWTARQSGLDAVRSARDDLCHKYEAEADTDQWYREQLLVYRSEDDMFAEAKALDIMESIGLVDSDERIPNSENHADMVLFHLLLGAGYRLEGVVKKMAQEIRQESISSRGGEALLGKENVVNQRDEGSEKRKATNEVNKEANGVPPDHKKPKAEGIVQENESSGANVASAEPDKVAATETNNQSKREESTGSKANGGEAVSKQGKLQQLPPIPPLSQVDQKTYLQLLVENQAGRPFGERNEKGRKSGGDAIYRELVIRGSATVFDLAKATLCAFGLESGQAATAKYKYQSNQGSLGIKDNELWLTDCPSSDPEKWDIKIQGVKYKPRDRFNKKVVPIGELKKLKLVQLLDRPIVSTGVERPGGVRRRLAMTFGLPDRPAFVSTLPGGRVSLAKSAVYEFHVHLGCIGKKEHLQSSLQDILGVRCTQGDGQVYGGNHMETFRDMDNLNCRFAAGKQMRGLVISSGDPEVDFYSCSVTMREPLIEDIDWDKRWDD